MFKKKELLTTTTKQENRRRNRCIILRCCFPTGYWSLVCWLVQEIRMDWEFPYFYSYEDFLVYR